MRAAVQVPGQVPPSRRRARRRRPRRSTGEQRNAMTRRSVLAWDESGAPFKGGSPLMRNVDPESAIYRCSLRPVRDGVGPRSHENHGKDGHRPVG